jgi:hypothetical protein
MVGVVKQKKKATGELQEYTIKMGKIETTAKMTQNPWGNPVNVRN